MYFFNIVLFTLPPQWKKKLMKNPFYYKSSHCHRDKAAHYCCGEVVRRYGASGETREWKREREWAREWARERERRPYLENFESKAHVSSAWQRIATGRATIAAVSPPDELSIAYLFTNCVENCLTTFPPPRCVNLVIDTLFSFFYFSLFFVYLNHFFCLFVQNYFQRRTTREYRRGVSFFNFIVLFQKLLWNLRFPRHARHSLS